MSTTSTPIHVYLEPLAPETAMTTLMRRFVDALTATDQSEATEEEPAELIPVTAEAASPADLARVALDRMVETEEQYGVSIAGWEHGGFMRTDDGLRVWGYITTGRKLVRSPGRGRSLDITHIHINEVSDPERWEIAFDATLVTRFP